MAQPNPGSSNGTVEHLMAAQIIRRLEQRIHFVMDIASSDTKNMVKDIMYDVYFEKEDYRLRVLELEDINNNLKLLLEEHGIDYSRVDYFPPVRPPLVEMAELRAGPGALSITLQVGPSPEPVVEHSVGPSEEHDESLVSRAEPVVGASAIPAEEPPLRTTGHLVEPLTEPSAETVSQPPVTEPMTEPSSEPVAEQQLGSVEPEVEPSVGPTDAGATGGGGSS